MKMSMFRTYTETYDMNTEQDCPTLIGIHTPIGTTPYKMLSPAFRMYKKYKYLGCDVTVVNAARLPVDPEQVGKIAGTNYIDPRDVLNPVMFKGCHGESLGSILDSMYNGLLANNGFRSATIDKQVINSALSEFYYTALGDDSWRKSPVQKTLSLRNLHPLVYQVAVGHQIAPTNSLEYNNYKTNNPDTISTPIGTGNSAGLENGLDKQSSVGAGWATHFEGPTVVFDDPSMNTPALTGLNPMFTNKMTRLGWMDTMQYIGQNTVPSGYNQGTFTPEKVAQLSKLFMGILMLPPANLCRQYLRVIIKHKFKFAQYRTITTGAIDNGEWDPANQTIGYANLYTGNIPDPETKRLDEEPLESDDDDE